MHGFSEKVLGRATVNNDLNDVEWGLGIMTLTLSSRVSES